MKINGVEVTSDICDHFDKVIDHTIMNVMAEECIKYDFDTRRNQGKVMWSKDITKLTVDGAPNPTHHMSFTTGNAKEMEHARQECMKSFCDHYKLPYIQLKPIEE